MKKLRLPIGKLFKALNIEHNDNEYNNKMGQTHIRDFNIFIKTPENKLTKINAFITKKSDTYEYTLENDIILKTSPKHIVLENGKEILIDNAKSVDNIDGNTYKIVNKKKLNDNEVVYDISIDYPHLYITPDGSIHHNTFFSNIILLYDLAHVLCLESPQEFYKLAASTKIDFIVSNSRKDNSESINFALLMGFIRQSPFFLSKLNYQHKSSMFINNIDLIPVAPVRRSLTGRAVFSSIHDEINRIHSQKQANEFITEIINRLPSRFLSEHNGKKYIPGHISFISSADTDNSIIELVKRSLSEENEAIDDNGITRNAYIEIRAKQFEVLREKVNYSEEKFYVFVGTYALEPKILESEVEINYYKSKYPDKVIAVPNDYYLTFKQNLKQAIGDILAIPVMSTMSLIDDKVKIVQAEKNINPCPDEILYDNETLLQNYFDISLLSQRIQENQGRPFAIGLDLAYSNDRLGISLACIKGLKGDRRIIDVIFATGIKGKSDVKLDFSKIRAFILWLRERYGIINAIYADTFQSYDFITILKNLGFNASQHSVDRKKESYYALKNSLYEETLILPKNQILEKELMFLRDEAKKIDHLEYFPDGTIGSKDIADAVCQAHQALLDIKYNAMFEKESLKELEEKLDIELVQAELGHLSNNSFNKLNSKNIITQKEFDELLKPVGT